MFTVTKRIEISAAHSLDLPYESKCKNIHGHNWIIEVEVSAVKLNGCGMVLDFTVISKVVKQYDHKTINNLMTTNPTAEHIAELIAFKINRLLDDEEQSSPQSTPRAWVSKVTVQESEGNIACYIP